MDANPFLSASLHWLNELVAENYYVPCKAGKKWSGETCRLARGFFSRSIWPQPFACLMADNLLGVRWGVGRLAFVFAFRYLGPAAGGGPALRIPLAPCLPGLNPGKVAPPGQELASINAV